MKARVRWFDSRRIYIFFILNLSRVFCSSQFGGAHANEIKHDHSPVVYIVLDHRYDYSYICIYITTGYLKRMNTKGTAVHIIKPLIKMLTLNAYYQLKISAALT